MARSEDVEGARVAWRGRAGRGDRRAVLSLVGFAVFLYAFPALVGHPLVPGDDLYQNLPLRILAGNLMADGHWPLWNLGIWSGTPLLAGLNAGALYPGTWLFVALPDLVAWVLNEIAVYAVCAVGVYLLLREHRLGPVAAALGAATFTFAGFMPAHLRHIGLVQGMSVVPWMLVAIERLARARPSPAPGWPTRLVGSRSHVGWALVLAACGGLVVLTGEPRAMSNAVLVVLAYLVFALGGRVARARLLTTIALAGLVALGLGAVQLLPGLRFIDASQRGDVGFDFFTFGSLPPRLLGLEFVPYLLGGYRDLQLMPGYRGPYRLPEVSGYVGLLPLVAAFTLPWWRRAASRPLWVFGLGLTVLGLVLSFGGSTPIGHVLAEIPFYGRQRLQSRNLALVDLGLAVLLAAWVDQLLRRRPAAPGEANPRPGRAERAVSLLPSAVVVGLLVAAWIWGPELQEVFDVPRVHEPLFGALRGYFLAAAVVALAVAVVVLVVRRLSPRQRTCLLVGLVALDLGLALLHNELGPVRSTHELDRSTTETRALEMVLSDGRRMAVYDPGTRISPADGFFVRAVTPDLTVLHDLPTVQGYGSIVEARYDAATLAHERRMIRPRTLEGTQADQLDLRVLLVPASYLRETSTPEGVRPQLVHPRLRDALVEPHWRRAGRQGPYLVFENTRAMGRAWVEPRPPTSSGIAATKAVPASVRRVDDQDGEVDVVRTDEPGLLVRSVAYSEGWRAEVRTGARTHTAPVLRRGLVQAIAVPAGNSTVTWRYEAPGFAAGLVLTTVSGLGALLVGLALVVSPRGSRRPVLEALDELEEGP
jgi:hypothetical protein